MSRGRTLATTLEGLRAAARRAGLLVHSLLGIAAAGGVVGLVVGAFLPAPVEPLLPQTAPALNRLVVAASAAFLGWWVGLLCGIAYLAARRRRP